MKLIEALKYLDEGLAIRKSLWKKAGIFIRKAEEHLDKIEMPEDFFVMIDGKAYGFAFVKGVRLFMNNGEWSVPWFCGLNERNSFDWVVIKENS